MDPKRGVIKGLHYTSNYPNLIILSQLYFICYIKDIIVNILCQFSSIVHCLVYWTRTRDFGTITYCKVTVKSNSVQQSVCSNMRVRVNITLLNDSEPLLNKNGCTL